MKFKLKDAKEFTVGEIKGYEYNTKEDFEKASVAFAKVKGKHGKLKNIKSDRVYIITEGKGKFIIDGKEVEVEAKDVIIIPKGTPYDYSGDMELFVVDTPSFEKEADIFLE
jgi:mannose-6-phosphate isomerase-like protein (cupin superfamily)